MDPGIEKVIRALNEGDDVVGRWHGALSAVGELMEAFPVRVWAFSAESNETFLDYITPGYPEAAQREYDARFQKSDPRVDAASRRPGRSHSCVETMPPEFEKSELVQDFLNRSDVDARWGLIHMARTTDGNVLNIGCARSKNQEPFLPSDKQQFDEAVRFLKRALELDTRVASLVRQKNAMTDVLDALSDAVMVVAEDLRILHLNAKAAALIGSGLGLRLKHGRLSAVQPEQQSALERIVASALNASLELAQTTVLHAGKGLPTLVRAYRLPTASPLATPAPMRQCVLIMRGGRHLDSGVDAVLRSFGLTSAELKLVRRLLQGVRLHECATETGVSTETVRSQLKSAHQKIGVRRQSELIRLLSQYAH